MVSDLTKRQQLAKLAGQHFGGERDLYQIMGYPRSLEALDYADAYKRGDLAARIVDAYPDSTWREAPDMVGSDAFKKEWEALEKKLHLFRTFHRLDRLTGMGHYGVLYLGLDGGEQPSQPTNGNNYNLLYLQPHSERTADVTQWEDDVSSPRYGMPKMYRITTGTNWRGAGAGQKVLTVHHSRVIHVAERALEDTAIGIPRLERIWNRLMDLDKLLGGSAEMYWQNVAMLLAFMADSDVEWEPDEKTDMADQLEELQNGLRRFLRLRGVTAEQLAPGLQGSDPNSHIDWQVKIISAATGIPQRLLLGNEAGELASSQDENNWAGKIAERREQFASPGIIEPFIQRGLKLGFLPEGYEYADWPESDMLGEQGRADVALKKAQAIATYANSPGSEFIVSPGEVRGWVGEEGEIALPEIDYLPEDDEQVDKQFTDPIAPEEEKPADKGLNGAQITAIKDIAEAVALKTMPKNTALALITTGFPFIDEETAGRILDPMDDFDLTKVAL